MMTSMSCKTCKPFKEYKEILDEEQKEKYEKIINERLKIYIYGVLIGVMIGLIYIYKVKGIASMQEYVKSNSCVFTAIVLFTQYIVYSLWKKSDWMITTLKTKEQREKWLEVYRVMKQRYHVGMLLGVVSYVILSYTYLKE